MELKSQLYKKKEKKRETNKSKKNNLLENLKTYINYFEEGLQLFQSSSHSLCWLGVVLMSFCAQSQTLALKTLFNLGSCVLTALGAVLPSKQEVLTVWTLTAWGCGNRQHTAMPVEAGTGTWTKDGACRASSALTRPRLWALLASFSHGPYFNTLVPRVTILQLGCPSTFGNLKKMKSKGIRVKETLRLLLSSGAPFL